MKVSDPRYYTVPYRTVPECLLNFDMYRCSASSQVKLFWLGGGGGESTC